MKKRLLLLLMIPVVLFSGCNNKDTEVENKTNTKTNSTSESSSTKDNTIDESNASQGIQIKIDE